MKSKAERAVCCIVTNDYAPEVARLGGYLEETNPGVPLYALVIGEMPSSEITRRYANVIWIPDTALFSAEPMAHLARKYTGFELCCATRGEMHQYMHQQTSIQKWIMLDTDMAVLSSLDPVWRLLDNDDVNALLTAHSTKTVPDHKVVPHELGILNNGLYNGGFLAMCRSAESLNIAQWLSARLLEYGYAGPVRGADARWASLNLFVDQLWLNLLPLYFSGVAVVEKERFNLGHWNLHQGQLAIAGGHATFNGDAVIIAHFSAVPANAPESVSSHTTLYSESPQLVWRSLYEEYLRRKQAVAQQFPGVRYTYRRRGVRVPKRLIRLSQAIRGLFG